MPSNNLRVPLNTFCASAERRTALKSASRSEHDNECSRDGPALLKSSEGESPLMRDHSGWDIAVDALRLYIKLSLLSSFERRERTSKPLRHSEPVIAQPTIGHFAITSLINENLSSIYRSSHRVHNNMSFRVGLLPHLARIPYTLPKIPSKRLFHFLSDQPHTPSPKSFLPRRSQAVAIARTRPAPPFAGRSNIRFYAALGLGLTFAYNTLTPDRSLHCATATTPSATTTYPYPEVGGGNPPAESILSIYELSFGAVAGICTGVFLKKGLRAIAFLLGGVFVLLQVSPVQSSSQFTSSAGALSDSGVDKSWTDRCILVYVLEIVDKCGLGSSGREI